MGQLPEDVILTEIMTRLAPKSILRFRCVSKSWKEFLSSDLFIMMHLNRVQQRQGQYDDMQHLILSDCYWYLQSIKYELACWKTTASLIDFPLPKLNMITVLGSRNGLLCVMRQETLFLWNPSINEFKELNRYVDGDGCRKGLHRDKFGFGYDRSTNDYKVVRFVRADEFYEDLSPSFVIIYSLKSNTWKRIQRQRLPQNYDEMFEDSTSRAGTLVDGVLYWICLSKLSQQYWILGFDIASDKFDVFTAPDHHVIINNEFGFTLMGMIGESLTLSVARDMEFGSNLEMWKLDLKNKGENKHYKWIKFMTIEKKLQPSTIYNFKLGRLVPICIMKNGEVLVSYAFDTANWIGHRKSSAMFELYDPVKGRFRELQVTAGRLLMKFWSEAITYTESLVSPNFDGSIGMIHVH